MRGEETFELNRARLVQEASLGLYELMLRENVSRAELARRLGCSRPFVSKLLGGSHNFTLHTLADIFGALGRTVHLTLGPGNACEFRMPVDEALSSSGGRFIASIRMADYSDDNTATQSPPLAA